MPELPEVETVRRTLHPRVVGRVVSGVRVRERRLRRELAPDFGERLRGRTIRDLRRLGKYLLFDLDDGGLWVVHLGMSGCLATRPEGIARHNHVDIDLSDGTTLTYNDPRRFGLMMIAAELPPEIADLGVDPMSEGYSAEYLRDLCRGRRRPIKNVLMDQHSIAGLGNIYASEILFRAGVRPTRRAASLRRREIEAIQVATREVLETSIRLGGSSISDYRDGEGRLGYFQTRFEVYGRAGEACRKCGGPIRARVLVGRSSFYCPACQR